VPPIHVGQPWQSDDPRNLNLRPFQPTREHLQALAQVRNETLQPITLPEDFAEMSAEEIDRFYNRPGFFSLEGNAWLLFLDDEPVGAAVVYPPTIFYDRAPGNFDMYVVPRLWRHGLGSRLLAHVEQAARERGHPVLETTIASEDSRSTGFLSSRGFSVVGHSLHMARLHTDNLPDGNLPEGYRLRSLADIGESPELYRVTANRLGAYDTNYSLIRPEEMESLISSDRWDPAGVLFLFDPIGRIVGVIRASRPAPNRGYLHEIRLEPSSRGKGLGTAILAAALRYLAATGVTRAELDTPGENTAAHALAQRAGFEVVRHWLHFLKLLRET
jgi:GNAT superfamily N-acetyltransferase